MVKQSEAGAESGAFHIKYDVTEELMEILADEFENLAFTRADNLAKRYQAAGALHMVERLLPVLRKAGLITDADTLPTRGCLRCSEEWLHKEGNPNHNSRLPDCRRPMLLQPDSRNCPIFRIRERLPRIEASGQVQDGMKSTSRKSVYENDR